MRAQRGLAAAVFAYLILCASAIALAQPAFRPVKELSQAEIAEEFQQILLSNAAAAAALQANLIHPEQATHEQWDRQTKMADREMDRLIPYMERVIILEEALWTLPDPNADRNQLRGELHAAVGVSYGRRSNRTENANRAIPHINKALELLGGLANRRRWGELQYLLGAVYRERRDGNRLDNVSREIAAYEAALTVLSSADMRLAADIHLYLGDARVRQARLLRRR